MVIWHCPFLQGRNASAKCLKLNEKAQLPCSRIGRNVDE